MFSNQYYQAVKDYKTFHENNKTFSGNATVDYSKHIKDLSVKHNAKSLLDYGCGKGLHYVKDSGVYFTNKKLTFNEYLEIDDVYKFDPCWEPFSQIPPKRKFDAVIAIQSLTAIPDHDIPVVVNQLMEYTGKFCFIGNRHPDLPVKQKKKQITNLEFFKEKRTIDWWHYQFRNWQGSELILHFQNT